MADDYSKKQNKDVYDEAFILKAVAVSFARTWSNQAIAASLCIPEELYYEWIRDYSDKVEVSYFEDVSVKGRRFDREKLERCPKCGVDAVFEPVRSFDVLREEGVDIGTQSSIMNSGDDGILGNKVPYVKITTEIISRCPSCGLYAIRNVTEKLSRSEA